MLDSPIVRILPQSSYHGKRSSFLSPREQLGPLTPRMGNRTPPLINAGRAAAQPLLAASVTTLVHLTSSYALSGIPICSFSHSLVDGRGAFALNCGRGVEAFALATRHLDDLHH